MARQMVHDPSLGKPRHEGRRWGLRWTEWPIEGLIVLCGWSSIFFVFSIFYFIFREAAPVLWGQPAAAQLTLPGENNDLIVSAVRAGSELNGIKIVLRAEPGGKVRFALDRRAAELVVSFDPAHTTARDLCAAAESDPLAAELRWELRPYDRGRGAAEAAGANDGSGPVRPPTRSPMLVGGRKGLDLIEFFISPNWRPASEIRPEYGTLALMIGSLSVTGLAMLLAVPLGLGAAVFVSEFCTGKVKETLKVVIELLAAVPSVVWGFIGLAVLGPIIMRATGATVGINLLNGGIILALMSVPIIVSVGEDALKAVPDSYREAALSLGASRLEIVYRVLFPAAKNGLLAAVLLGVGRAIGETMAVLMATGHAIQIPHSLLDPIRTLTATIAAELGETVKGDEHYRVLFLIGVMLFVITMAVNMTADLVVKGIRGDERH